MLSSKRRQQQQGLQLSEPQHNGNDETNYTDDMFDVSDDVSYMVGGMIKIF